MYIFNSLLCFLCFALSVTASSPQYLFSNPPFSQDGTSLQIPTSYESAILGRRILHLTPLGTLSTIFPSSSSPENRPPNLSGLSIGLMDYISDCEEPSIGNPTILAIKIATSFKNVAAGSNISLSLQWTPPYPPKSRISSLFSFFSKGKDTVPYSAVNLPRFSLLGYLEKIPEKQVSEWDLNSCFTESHPDARYWLPGNSIHESEWVRLVVEEIYWIGGFGDRAYIGWIPVEEWRNVTREEWESVRLPGEKKGWKEWSVREWEL